MGLGPIKVRVARTLLTELECSYGWATRSEDATDVDLRLADRFADAADEGAEMLTLHEDEARLLLERVRDDAGAGGRWGDWGFEGANLCRAGQALVRRLEETCDQT